LDYEPTQDDHQPQSGEHHAGNRQPPTTLPGLLDVIQREDPRKQSQSAGATEKTDQAVEQ
jgi:hypothetical protein